MSDPQEGSGLSSGLVTLLALSCGLAVANLYYAQPLLDVIVRDFQITVGAAGITVTVTQLGYAAGLLTLAPLGDRLENRRLITTMTWACVVALLGAGMAGSFPVFLLASLIIGVTSSVVQVMVPLAAYLAPPERRGELVGKVMSGLLLGILLARAYSGILSGRLGWRAVYALSAGMLTLLNLVLYRALPRRRPAFEGSYLALMASLGEIFRQQPVLRRRAAYQGAMFGGFSVFWTSVTFLLARPPFSLSQTGIGLFALAGAAGAMMAPLAGRWGDAGRGKPATGGALLLGVGAFGLTLVQRLWALVAGAILLDLAVNTTLVIGQQAVYSLNPAQRSRLNTLYIATFFCGGAAGSALAGLAFGRGGWPAVVALGAGLPAAAFLFWLTEPARGSRSGGR